MTCLTDEEFKPFFIKQERKTPPIHLTLSLLRKRVNVIIQVP